MRIFHADIALVEVITDVDHFPDGAAEPVELPHHQGVAWPQVAEHRGEPGPAGGGLPRGDLLLKLATDPGGL